MLRAAALQTDQKYVSISTYLLVDGTDACRLVPHCLPALRRISNRVALY